MRFDSHLARKILLALEDAPPVTAPRDIVLEGRSRDDISYHIRVLYQDNMVDAVDISTVGSLHWKAKSLTAEGHKFLDEIKNDTSWAQVKTIAKTQGIRLTISSIKGIIAQHLKKKPASG